MSGNSLGKIFKLTSFGESHGKAIGGIIDGCPPEIEIDIDFIQHELARRKPGQSNITSSRKEDDIVEFFSGIYEGKSTGTPISFAVFNKDVKSSDYETLKDAFRPSHADYTYQTKYGIRDYRGSGRASARETIARVVGGAIAKIILKNIGVRIFAYTSQVGKIILEKNYHQLDLSLTDNNSIRCPDYAVAQSMIQLVEKIKKEGDSVGGVITCVAKNVPAGLGEPVFDKLHAELGKAMLSINAVKGFEYGSGFGSAFKKGSENNDEFYLDKNKEIRTTTNYSGGIQGGISNGEDIYFRVAFKPISTIMKPQNSIDINKKEIIINPEGRHDPCVLPRAVPIVEAMTALVLADYYLQNLVYGHFKK